MSNVEGAFIPTKPNITTSQRPLARRPAPSFGLVQILARRQDGDCHQKRQSSTRCDALKTGLTQMLAWPCSGRNAANGPQHKRDMTERIGTFFRADPCELFFIYLSNHQAKCRQEAPDNTPDAGTAGSTLSQPMSHQNSLKRDRARHEPSYR